MLKKLLTSFILLGIVVLALASSGGGGNKKNVVAKTAFKPVANSTGFTLKAGPRFAGSQVFSSQKKDFVLYNTLVTYQKGNTIYILPYHYKLNDQKACTRSNFNVIDLKIRLHK